MLSRKKAKELKDVPRLGRTCMQDAVPMTFGQVFGAWHSLIARNRKRLENLVPEYRNHPWRHCTRQRHGELPDITETVYKHLSKVVGFEMKQAKFAARSYRGLCSD